MSKTPRESLKPMRFEGELLPSWARLLDLAAKLAPVSTDVRQWFARFANSSGVEDARIVCDYCGQLRAGIRENEDAIAAALGRSRGDKQPAQIIAAWNYSLDTMIQVARVRKTCSWLIKAGGNATIDDSGDGDVALRVSDDEAIP
jgi:hypothetical protein